MAPLTPSEVGALQVGYATPCLGMHPSHTLELKFAALQAAGFKFVELGFGNYVSWVRSKLDLPPSTCPEEWKVDDEPDPSDDEIWSALYEHAPALCNLASAHGLTLLIMQPLNQFDGWPADSPRADWARRKAERWLLLCSRIGVQYLQVGANDQAGLGAGDAKTAEDLRWLAELGARQDSPVKIAYENWCFSPRVNSWEHCYEIVKMANHPNLGLCLDTAQMALAPPYGLDPETGAGWTDHDVAALIDRLKALDPRYIFFFEISDVLKPDPPLYHGSPYDDWSRAQPPDTPARSNWVLCARSVPYVGRACGRDVCSERDLGVARVAEIAKAVFSTGFRGPVIWEVFESVEMEREDESVPRRFAEASGFSRRKLFDEITRGM